MLNQSRRLFVVALTLLLPASALGQAYCALRDPVTSIYDLFPQADGYRSIVKVVGNAARASIREQLALDLHFNELGQHTVYVALRDGQPLGIVHARSEKGRWGLTEIAWALSLDLDVMDYRFQRSRNPRRSELQGSQLSDRLKGADVADLKRFLDEGPELDAHQYDKQLLDLWSILLRSALKTIVVTETSWRDELVQLRGEQARSIAVSGFPGAEAAVRITSPYTEDVQSELRNLRLGEELSIPRGELSFFRVMGGGQAPIGFFAAAPWRSGDVDLYLHWFLDETGRIVDVSSPQPDLPPDMRSSLAQLHGLTAAHAEQCATAL